MTLRGRAREARVLLAIGCLVVACQTAERSRQSLPAEPIALICWDGKAARFRQESFANAGPPGEAPADRTGAQEMEIRAHLRAEKHPRLASKLTKHIGRLVLYWPRTGEREPIEAAPAGARPLSWSPDHRRLLFMSMHRDERPQLYEYDLESRRLGVLTSGPRAHELADYDARGDLVVLRTEPSRRGGASHRSIHLASAGGRMGPELARGVHPGTLRLTPDGRTIVYEQVRVRPRSAGPALLESFIATRSLEPGAPERMLMRGREPALTPDGRWIVFASPSSAGYRLRRMRLDGTARIPISPGGSEERMPSVSPDGAYVAFIQDVGGYRRLAVRRFDGRSERVLTKTDWCETPVW